MKKNIKKSKTTRKSIIKKNLRKLIKATKKH